MVESIETFLTVTNRLKAALFLGTDLAVAERLGMTRTAFAERKRRGRLPEAELKALCEREGLEFDWVSEGRGEMRRGATELLKPLKDAADIVQSLSLDGTSARTLQELLQYSFAGDRERVLPLVRRLRLAAIPRFDVQASAGPGRAQQVEEVTEYMAFDADWLRQIGVQDAKKLAVIAVKGDSMAETLGDGDLILVDTKLVERRTPGVYVILKEDSLLVKRLNFKLNGAIEIRSDNKAYPTETLSPADFDRLHLVGRMVRRVVR